jgi:hypothetical protein
MSSFMSYNPPQILFILPIKEVEVGGARGTFGKKRSEETVR